METNRSRILRGCCPSVYYVFMSAVLCGNFGAVATQPTQKQVPIEISSVHNLARIGNDDSYPLDGHYILTTDIDASAANDWNGGRDLVPIALV